MSSNGNRSMAPNGGDPRRDGNGRNRIEEAGALRGEMGFHAGTDSDAELLVRGEAPAGTDPSAELLVRGEAPAGTDPSAVEVAALARELRAACVKPPAGPARERQLAAIVAEARAQSAGSAVAAGRDGSATAARRPPARRGRALAFRLAAIGLVGLVGTAGLAAAGVRPPAAVDHVLERIGISGDDRGDARAPGGDAEPSEPRRDGDAGSAPPNERRGAGARSGAARDAGGKGGRADRRSNGEGSRETGRERSQPGRDTAEEAQSGQTPPTSPGRSGEHRPEGAGPPASPGAGNQGKPPTPPGSGGNSGGSAKAPNENAGFGQQRAGDARADHGPVE